MHWCFSSEKWIIIPKQRDNCQGELNLYQALGQRRWVKKRGGEVRGGLRGPTLLSSAFLSLLFFPTNWEVKKKNTGLAFPLNPWKCPWQVLLSSDLIIRELPSSLLLGWGKLIMKKKKLHVSINADRKLVKQNVSRRFC